MKFNVYMLGFMNGEIRVVDVPDEKYKGTTYDMLDTIFYYGQNDFQPVGDRCSVSVGDVIDYLGKYYLVRTAGFQEISQEELNDLKTKSLNNPSSSNVMDSHFGSSKTKNNKEKTKMSNKFNLGGYLKSILSAKKKDDKQGDQIETKLNEKNKKEEEPQEITEKLLQKDREDTEETTIEKKLEKVRAGSEEMLVEGQLNKSKSSIIKHRNADTAKGNINKLEEKRLAGDTMESEKQEPASEVDKPRRFWENKSPDGLKLAKSIKIAQDIDNFDIDNVDSLPREYPDLRERLSPKLLMDLDKLRRQDQEFKKTDVEESPETMERAREDIINDLNDPETLNNIFSEEVVGQDESSGTKVEERKIIFDLKEPDGEINEIFKSGNDIDKNVLKQAIMKFINLTHIEDVVDINALYIDIDKANLTGSATYIVPVG